MAIPDISWINFSPIGEAYFYVNREAIHTRYNTGRTI